MVKLVNGSTAPWTQSDMKFSQIRLSSRSISRLESKLISTTRGIPRCAKPINVLGLKMSDRFCCREFSVSMINDPSLAKLSSIHGCAVKKSRYLWHVRNQALFRNEPSWLQMVQVVPWEPASAWSWRVVHPIVTTKTKTNKLEFTLASPNSAWSSLQRMGTSILPFPCSLRPPPQILSSPFACID